MNSKLSWEDTYKSMSETEEDWSDFDNVIDDGYYYLGFGSDKDYQ